MYALDLYLKERVNIHIFTCTELILKNYLERFVLLCLKQYMYIYTCMYMCL